MPGSDTDKPDIRLQFRQAAKEACKPKIDAKMDSKTPPNLLASGNTSKVDSQWSDQNGNTKSYAQVAGLVLPKPGALKRRDGVTIFGITNRPSPLSIRLSEQHKEMIRAKAQAAGVSVNEYVKAVILGGDYRPTLSKEVFSSVQGLSRLPRWSYWGSYCLVL